MDLSNFKFSPKLADLDNIPTLELYPPSSSSSSSYNPSDSKRERRYSVEDDDSAPVDTTEDGPSDWLPKTATTPTTPKPSGALSNNDRQTGRKFNRREEDPTETKGNTASSSLTPWQRQTKKTRTTDTDLSIPTPSNHAPPPTFKRDSDLFNLWSFVDLYVDLDQKSPLKEINHDICNIPAMSAYLSERGLKDCISSEGNIMLPPFGISGSSSSGTTPRRPLDEEVADEILRGLLLNGNIAGAIKSGYEELQEAINSRVHLFNRSQTVAAAFPPLYQWLRVAPKKHWSQIVKYMRLSLAKNEAMAKMKWTTRPQIRLKDNSMEKVIELFTIMFVDKDWSDPHNLVANYHNYRLPNELPFSMPTSW